MGEIAPGTRVKTYRTDRDTLEEYWDILGVVRRRDYSDKYESYLVSWRNGSEEFVMMRDEFDTLTGEEERLAIVEEVMWS